MLLDAVLTSVLCVFGIVAPALAQNITGSTSVRWHIPLVGPAAQSIDSLRPLHRFSHVTSPGSNKKRSLLFVVSDLGVLAALQPNNGSIGELTGNM